MQLTQKTLSLKKTIPKNGQYEQSLTDLIQQPDQLKLLILETTEIPLNQLTIISQCVNLIKLDLAQNKLESLQTVDFSNLKQLRILYLHQNLFPNILSIKNIFKAKNLNYISLYQNPCASQATFRHIIISAFSKLQGMDFNAISDEERYPDAILSYSIKYSCNCPKTKISWPIVNYFQEEIKENQEEQLISMIWRELDKIRMIFSRCSAILTIQRIFRGHRQRQILLKEKEKEKKILEKVKWVAQKWMKITQNSKDLKEILQKAYSKQFKKLKEIYQKYKQKKIDEGKFFKSILVIKRVLRNFKNLTDKTISSIEFEKYNKLYFSIDQIDLFFKIIGLIKQKARTNRSQIIREIEQIELFSKKVLNISDFERPYRIYHSQVKTYRIPHSFYFYGNNCPNFTNPVNMLKQIGYAPKVSLSLISKKEEIIRKHQFKRENNYVKENLTHKYPFLQYYQAKMPLKTDLEIRTQFRLNPVEKERFISTLNRINIFQEREYQQFVSISITNRFLMKEIIKFMWRWNSDQYVYQQKHQNQSVNENEIGPSFFLGYFELFIIKNAAALKIQRTYRRYKIVQITGMNFQYMIQTFKQQKAIKSIQRWIRSIKYQHRNSFFKSLAFRLKQIQTDELFLPMNIYVKLNEIIKKNRMKFLEQIHDIILLKNTCELRYNLFKIHVFDKYFIDMIVQKTIFPDWVIKINKPKKMNDEDILFGDIFHLLHYRTSCQISNFNGIKWISFKFSSVEECRKRFSFLQLHSYQFKGNGCAIDLFELVEIQGQLIEKYKWSEMKIQQMIKAFKLPLFSLDTEPKVAYRKINNLQFRIPRDPPQRLIGSISPIQGFKMEKFMLKYFEKMQFKSTLYFGICYPINFWDVQFQVDEGTQYFHLINTEEQEQQNEVNENNQQKQTRTNKYLTTDTSHFKTVTYPDSLQTQQMTRETDKNSISANKIKRRKQIKTFISLETDAHKITIDSQQSRLPSGIKPKLIVSKPPILNKIKEIISYNVTKNDDKYVTSYGIRNNSQKDQLNNLERIKQFREEKIKQFEERKIQLENKVKYLHQGLQRLNMIFDRKLRKIDQLKCQLQVKQISQEKEMGRKKTELFQSEKLKKRCESHHSSNNYDSLLPLEKKDSFSYEKHSHSKYRQEKIISHKFMHAIFPEEIYPYL